MQILKDKIVNFNNNIDSDLWINLIETVSVSAYPLSNVSRRPHLTMELPAVFNENDTYESIKLRKMIYDIAVPSFMEYMKYYNHFKVKQFKTYITVSKLLDGSKMNGHIDNEKNKHIIGMLYINDNYNGGELGFKELDFKYKPKSGDFIIYPGSIQHEVTRMSGNPRYTAGFALV